MLDVPRSRRRRAASRRVTPPWRKFSSHKATLPLSSARTIWGDRNEFLPTVHGFDEWFSNLYHLNAEEEPEQLDYPGQKNPAYKTRFGPRGVLHTWATTTDDPTVDPKFGKVGTQRIQDTEPLTRKRMVAFDQEVTDETLKYLDRVGKGDKPFFIWFNSTAIHIWSHPNPKYVQMAVDEGRAEWRR